MSVYRVDRGHVAVLSGLCVIAAGVAAFVAFLLMSRVAGTIVVLLLLVAALAAVRPPKVATLDEHGLRARRLQVRWSDVENVRTQDGRLVLHGATGDHRLSLAPLGRRAQEFLLEVRERMNTAHGYTEYKPDAEG